MAHSTIGLSYKLPISRCLNACAFTDPTLPSFFTTDPFAVFTLLTSLKVYLLCRTIFYLFQVHTKFKFYISILWCLRLLSLRWLSILLVGSALIEHGLEYIRDIHMPLLLLVVSSWVCSPQVILSSLLVVGQHRVGFRDFLEGVFITTTIWMVFHSKLSVRLLYVVCRSAGIHTQNFI